MDGGLLLIRVVLGAIVAVHGAQKLFGWFGGAGIHGTAGWLESMRFRPARLFATVNGLAEFGGGALLALGLLTPLGAAAVAGVMFVAIALVHRRNGFFNSNGGYEFNLLIVATAIGLAIAGPGRFSIDDLAGWNLGGPEWGLAAFGVAAAAAVAVLVTRGQLARGSTSGEEEVGDELHAA
jgi:putative oxidoreductase